ncbi:DUF3575 domain-containing protein [uncultured Alistipes sp.]|uniref:DUF3575 domain-containing protein n=1 Tax=uncultured Alistipes sp. TaxID=538949 RepID=UPI0025E898FB|nr:DUF3575 domain-containing protein [uncultured Alistipes sp.]
MKRLTLLLFCLAGLAMPAIGQSIGVKTNLLYGGVTLTPNLGLEVGLGQRTTLDLSVGYNPWNRNGDYGDNKKLVHLLVQPEFRWWTCERFNGHFFGVHAIFSKYNVGGHKVQNVFKKDFRYEGFAYGGGISYGYHLMLGTRWGLEFNVGVGVAHLAYDRYGCDKCAGKVSKGKNTYFGPTRAGITLVFLIK